MRQALITLDTRMQASKGCCVGVNKVLFHGLNGRFF